jgi:translin
MPTLKSILLKIRKELEEREKVRESSQDKERKATRLSKQAILLMHQKKVKEAEKLIENAKELVQELYEASRAHPEIVHSGMFSAALQEYSEANIFFRLVERSEFATPHEIGVPSADYILGLADVIGEYRRLTLDALREGDAEKGEKCLRMMDEIYTELMALDEAYMLVSGLRRKCDVARKIIEITRGDVTQEIRRSSLEKQLEHFERSMKNKSQDNRAC